MNDDIANVLLYVAADIVDKFREKLLDEIKSKYSHFGGIAIFEMALPMIDHSFESGIANGVLRGYELARTFTDEQVRKAAEEIKESKEKD